MIAAYIGLGANIENPVVQLMQATQLLAAIPQTSVTHHSAIYRSPPLGPQDQPDFYNACVKLLTGLSSNQLLAALQSIEQAMGRVKHRRWGERCIDLDLLIFGTEQRNTSTLQLPHPGIAERDFVLKPLRELVDGSFVVPGSTDIDTLTARCGSTGAQRTHFSLTSSSKREVGSDTK